LHSKSINVNRPVLQRAAGEQIPPHGDASSESGAEELAQRVRTYWTARGAVVTVRVERIEDVAGRRPAFRLVSDLSSGLPQRR